MGETKIRKTNITFVGTTLDIDTVGNFEIEGVSVTADAAELSIMEGVTADAAELSLLENVTATTEEINLLDGFVAAATISTTGCAAQVEKSRSVGIILKDLNGDAVTGVKTSVLAYLSQDATGTPSTGISTIAISSTGGVGALIITLAAYDAYQLISSSDGLIDVVISSTGSTTAKYLSLILPNGEHTDSALLTFAGT